MSPSDSKTEPPRLRNQAEKESMLTLINEARAANGVPPVVMGGRDFAQLRAEQLLEDCILSHWGTDGLKPYMRYSLAGGYQVNRENITSTNECGLMDGWTQWNDHPEVMIREAVAGLLESEDHREAMLNPHFATVNIGLAWDRHTFKTVNPTTRPTSSN